MLGNHLSYSTMGSISSLTAAYSGRASIKARLRRGRGKRFDVPEHSRAPGRGTETRAYGGHSPNVATRAHLKESDAPGASKDPKFLRAALSHLRIVPGHAPVVRPAIMTVLDGDDHVSATDSLVLRPRNHLCLCR